MKLRVYLFLGIDVQADTICDYNGAVIRSNCKGDVHVIIFNTNLSGFFFIGSNPIFPMSYGEEVRSLWAKVRTLDSITITGL